MSSVDIKDFDEILKVIAKTLFTNSDIDDLGKALGFEDADIGRATDENTRQGGNYMGTYGLLKKWRRRQTSLTEKAALRSALVNAGFHNLASKYLSTPITGKRLFVYSGLMTRFIHKNKENSNFNKQK